jgi:hypothetical protein
MGKAERSKWAGAHESKRDASEFQTFASRVADREKLPLLLDKARQFAGEYIDSLEERPVFPVEKSLRAMDALIESTAHQSASSVAPL